MDIRTAIDSQLMELGCFSPIEWLLNSGHLHYEAYEQWRQGDVGYLEDIVSLPHEQLAEQLQEVEVFSGQLGLTNEPQDYFCWQREGASQQLSLCREPQLSALLSKRWFRQQQDAPQMDLFMDNPAVVTENRLIDSLGDRQWNEAQRCLDLLYQQSPGHLHLGHYEGLVAYGLHTLEPIETDLAAIEEELTGLESEILPLAKQLLRQKARDYLAPAWQRVAEAMESLPADSGPSALHASYAWEKLQNWPRVKSSILDKQSADTDPQLKVRLATAYCYLQQREQALLCWCHLFHLDEDFAATQIEKFPDRQLINSWQLYADLEAEPPLSHFPAWLLLQERGLLHHIDSGWLHKLNDPIFKTVLNLLKARHQDNTAEEMGWRKELQLLSPLHLRAYLQMSR